MKARVFKLCGLLMAVLCSCPLFAQNYTLQGSIKKEPPASLDGIVVTLLVKDSLAGTTLTDKKGAFSFPNLPKGHYVLHAYEAKYQQITDSFLLDAPKKMAYILYPEKEVNLSDVVVTADRSRHVTPLANGEAFSLSSEARSRKDPYKALREIPLLHVDALKKTITTVDGDTPLILINGVKQEGKFDMIDPKDIESVELIDMPSARHLKDGVKAVLNIKLKRESERYHALSAYTAQTFNKINYGESSLGYETGGAKSSFYINAYEWYVYKNKIRLSETQRNGDYEKTSQVEGNHYEQYYNLALGGDYLPSERNYFSYSITYTPQMVSEKLYGNGEYNTQSPTDHSSPFQTWRRNPYHSYINTYNTYYKHTFAPKRFLETTFRFNLNGQGQTNERNEDYTLRPDFYDQYQYKNNRISSSLELNYSFPWKGQISDIGSRTDFRRDHIRQITQPFYRYREWTEYAYADVAGRWKKFSYMASLGINMLFNRSEYVNNHFVRPQISASVNYRLNPKNSFRLAYTLLNNPLPIGLMNPYVTTTDSLDRSVGNPYLTPSRRHDWKAAYQLNTSKLYFAPQFSYWLWNDLFVSSGTSEGNVYTGTYINSKKHTTGWRARANLRYNINNWASLNADGGYQMDYYNAINRGTYFFDISGNVDYKKWNFYFSINYRRLQDYNATYTVKSKRPYSHIELNWAVSKCWTVFLAANSLFGDIQTTTTTQDAGYYGQSVWKSYQGLYAAIGFRYTFRSKSKVNRAIKRLNATEQGIQL